MRRREKKRGNIDTKEKGGEGVKSLLKESYEKKKKRAHTKMVKTGFGPYVWFALRLPIARSKCTLVHNKHTHTESRTSSLFFSVFAARLLRERLRKVGEK